MHIWCMAAIATGFVVELLLGNSHLSKYLKEKVATFPSYVIAARCEYVMHGTWHASTIVSLSLGSSDAMHFFLNSRQKPRVHNGVRERKRLTAHAHISDAPIQYTLLLLWSGTCRTWYDVCNTHTRRSFNIRKRNSYHYVLFAIAWEKFSIFRFTTKQLVIET